MRRMLLILGVLALAATWLGPLPQWAPHAFWAHMTMHMGVVAVAAPLIAFGLAGTRADLAQRHPQVFSPIPASVVELVIVWAWHAPGLHHWARHHAAGMFIEQSMFLSAGLLVWLASVGGANTFRDSRTELEARRRDAQQESSARASSTSSPAGPANRLGAGIVALLLTSMHMTLLGALLALTPRPLYAHGQVVGGLTALQDQHLGGAIMLFVGGVSYLLGGLWLTVALLRTRTALSAKPGDAARETRVPGELREPQPAPKRATS